MKKVLSLFLSLSLIVCIAFSGASPAMADEGYDILFEDNQKEEIEHSVIDEIIVSQVGKTEVSVYWNCSYYGFVDGYEVSLYDGKTDTYLPQAYVDCNTYSYVFRNLKQNTGYQVCVRSFVFDNGTYDFGQYSTPAKIFTCPVDVKLSSVKHNSKGKATVKWKKCKNVSGYVIEYSPKKDFKDDASKSTVMVYGKSKSRKVINGLAKGKYYFRIAAFKKVDDTIYVGIFSKKVKRVHIKRGLSVKGMLNAIKTDNSGAQRIKKYTDGGVNIAKYKTTYDKVKAIYVWHARNFKKHGWDCVGCNSNFNNCISALFSNSEKRYDGFITLNAGKFRNNDGSKVMHKWSVIYLAGKPYIFDPRLQGYTKNYTANTYFALAKNSRSAKPYIYEYDYGTFYPDESNAYFEYCVESIK